MHVLLLNEASRRNENQDGLGTWGARGTVDVCETELEPSPTQCMRAVSRPQPCSVAMLTLLTPEFCPASTLQLPGPCLLYTSDAADDWLVV